MMSMYSVCLHSGKAQACSHKECAGGAYVPVQTGNKTTGLAGSTHMKFKDAWQRDRKAANGFLTGANGLHQPR